MSARVLRWDFRTSPRWTRLENDSRGDAMMVGVLAEGERPVNFDEVLDLNGALWKVASTAGHVVQGAAFTWTIFLIRVEPE